MPLGNRGHFGIKKEVTWGLRDGVGANDIFLPFVSEGLTHDIEDVVSAIQRGILDQPKSYQGERKCGGPIVIEVHPVSIGHILRSALGAPTGGNLVVTSEDVIENCDDAWTYHGDVIGSIDGIDKKKGTHSNKIIVPVDVASGDVLAYKDFGKVVGEDISFASGAGPDDDVISQVAATFLEQKFMPGDLIIITGSLAGNNDITTEILSVTAGTINVGNGLLTPEGAAETITIQSAKDMSLVTGFKIWIKASTNTVGGDLDLVLGENVGGGFGGTEYLGDIGVLVANVWTEVVFSGLDLTGGDYDEVKCVGLRLGADLLEFTVRIDHIRMVVAGAADVARLHIFTPMETEAEEFGGGAKYTPLWPYTFEVFRDDSDDKAYEFLGCVVNTMQLSFSNTDKILKATLGIIAKSAGYVNATVLSLESTNPFVWDNAKIGIGGTAAGAPYLDMESFTLNWDNKCIPKFTLNNSEKPRRIVRAGYREIPISFTIDFVDRTEYDYFLLGTERQFQIKFEGAVVGADAADTPYTLEINFPKVRYTAFPIVNSGPGRLTVSVTAVAKYDAGVGYAMLINLINDQLAAVYAG